METNNNYPIESSAILLLEKILFYDWKLQNAKLTLIAINASLIPQLIELYESNSDTEVRQSIYRLYLFLLFVIAKDHKEVRKSILKTDHFLTSIIRRVS